VVRRGPRRSLALDREGDDVAAPDVDELSGAPAVAAVREEVADAHELGGASAGLGRESVVRARRPDGRFEEERGDLHTPQATTRASRQQQGMCHESGASGE